MPGRRQCIIQHLARKNVKETGSILASFGDGPGDKVASTSAGPGACLLEVGDVREYRGRAPSHIPVESEGVRRRRTIGCKDLRTKRQYPRVAKSFADARSRRS